MAIPSTRTGQPDSVVSLWFRYTLAVVASFLAWLLTLGLNRIFDPPVTPFLPGFAAIIASAAWAGFGPGICATCLVTTWAAVFLHSQNLHSEGGQIFRCLMFAGEGVLLSIGSGRLRSAMRKAADSEEWHRQLMQTALEGILVTDNQGVITYANPRMAEILGIELNHLSGRNMEEFFFPADRSVENIRLLNQRSGAKEQFDRRLRRLDGTEVWVLTCASPQRVRGKEVPGALSMMTDITERRNAESALRHSEKRFRSLFENVLEGVYQSTPDGRILAANPMLLLMLGLSHEQEMNDVNIANDLYVTAGVRAGLLERLEQEGRFRDVEYELRRRDGKVITVHENARVVRDEEGRVLYYEGTLTDVTERKRDDSQLLQAQKMEALGRLAGGIAHDFTNVLTVISGYAQLILGELPESHQSQSNARLLVAASESAGALTAQLLSFSRRESDLQIPADLNAIVRDSEQQICAFLNERTIGPGVELTTVLSSRPLAIHADAGHVRQTLLSLAANVRDTMDDGRLVRVVTQAARLTAGALRGVYATVSVDCGTAASQNIDHIGDQEPADGFGLATAKAIMAQYDGIIMMSRADAGNAVLTLYLPLAEEKSESLPGGSQSSIATSALETILLVDDEPLVREISRDMLERHGYHVLLAPGPAEAERIGRQGTSFDLLITDVAMPQITGPELATRLRALNPALKVLFISGHSDRESAESGIRAADAYLQKPFSADSLQRRIRQLLDRH